MNINYILSENPQFKFVGVTFKNADGSDSKVYHYKTLLTDLEIGYDVIVPTGRATSDNVEYKVATIVEFANITEVSNNYSYKWVVQVVDYNHYQECSDTEQKVQAFIKQAEAKKAREEFKANFIEYIGEEQAQKAIDLVKL